MTSVIYLSAPKVINDALGTTPYYVYGFHALDGDLADKPTNISTTVCVTDHGYMRKGKGEFNHLKNVTIVLGQLYSVAPLNEQSDLRELFRVTLGKEEHDTIRFIGHSIVEGTLVNPTQVGHIIGCQHADIMLGLRHDNPRPSLPYELYTHGPIDLKTFWGKDKLFHIPFSRLYFISGHAEPWESEPTYFLTSAHIDKRDDDSEDSNTDFKRADKDLIGVPRPDIVYGVTNQAHPVIDQVLGYVHKTRPTQRPNTIWLDTLRKPEFGIYIEMFGEAILNETHTPQYQCVLGFQQPIIINSEVSPPGLSLYALETYENIYRACLNQNDHVTVTDITDDIFDRVGKGVVVKADFAINEPWVKLKPITTKNNHKLSLKILLSNFLPSRNQLKKLESVIDKCELIVHECLIDSSHKIVGGQLYARLLFSDGTYLLQTSPASNIYTRHVYID